MRVLVKCLAMLGLGTDLYAGEDVPDQSNDQKVVKGSSSVVGAVLEDMDVDWTEVHKHVTKIQAGYFNEDDDAIKTALEPLKNDNDMKVAVWSKLDSKLRSHITKTVEPRS